MTNRPTTPVQRLSALDAWHAASTRTAIDAMIAGAQKLCFIVPHPDDETLGCGGLIAGACDRGLDVTVILLTDGSRSHPGSRSWPARRVADQRAREILRAVGVLGCGRARLELHNLPDGALSDHRGHVVQSVNADIVVTCHEFDPQPDHRAAYAISAVAAANAGARLLTFPVWALTTEAPPPSSGQIWQIDVAPYLSLKRRALAEHQSQLGHLIRDDPGAFVLDDGLQALFVRSDELYYEEDHGYIVGSHEEIAPSGTIPLTAHYR